MSTVGWILFLLTLIAFGVVIYRRVKLQNGEAATQAAGESGEKGWRDYLDYHDHPVFMWSMVCVSVLAMIIILFPVGSNLPSVTSTGLAAVALVGFLVYFSIKRAAPEEFKSHWGLHVLLWMGVGCMIFSGAWSVIQDNPAWFIEYAGVDPTKAGPSPERKALTEVDQKLYEKEQSQKAAKIREAGERKLNGTAKSADDEVLRQARINLSGTRIALPPGAKIRIVKADEKPGKWLPPAKGKFLFEVRNEITRETTFVCSLPLHLRGQPCVIEGKTFRQDAVPATTIDVTGFDGVEYIEFTEMATKIANR